MIHSVFIELYVNILIWLNLSDPFTALDSHILDMSNLFKVNSLDFL